MKGSKFLAILAGFVWTAVLWSSAAESARISLDLRAAGHPISPTLYGIFFEDINCSADGGLYAELVRNRNFEESGKPDFWTALVEDGSETLLSIDASKPVSEKNPHALRVEVKRVGAGRAGVANDGYWGIGVVTGESYELHLYARSETAEPLVVSLEAKDGRVYAQKKTPKLTRDWKKYDLTFKARESDPKARLVINRKAAGVFWLDMVSLFPRKTWKGRENGLRSDLAGMLANLQPRFVRFPGGCWVEGERMDLAYRWKQTIGPIAERRTQRNIWQYQATHGIGYHEYLQACEDLGAEPLFVINCGMSHKETVPMGEMGEFVQDALDAIEYANGAPETKWGSLRAQNGHPTPFGLKYLEIGNENGGAAYHERYALFYDAIKAKYPEVKLIANEWRGRPTNRPIEIIDEHYYSTPEFFIRNADKYDHYDRAGPRVYVGEYAVTQGCGQGNLRAAVGEAAFMTGLERNSDVVVMASYAPLFANVNYKKWNPDLINFDSALAYGTPSYYVQQMFNEKFGKVTVPVKVVAEPVMPQASGAVGVGTWLTQAEFKDLKVVQGERVLFRSDFSKGTEGWRLRGGDWRVSQGVLRQESGAENVRAFAGDKNWTNYTYTLKARKTGGAEGFLIPFLVQKENAKAWWNIGGWGNQRHAIEMDGIMASEVAGSIETGRWYDIRIEVQPNGVKCYLDDKLIHDAKFEPVPPLAVSASRDGKRLFLKVVNASERALTTGVAVLGGTVGKFAEATVLASGDASDENSLTQPRKVAPRIEHWKSGTTGLSQVFPGNSVTVVELKAEDKP